jgi:DNA-binding MarR family transcriptional regulator
MVASATSLGQSLEVADEFRTLLQGFIRRFGLLAGDQTPCGKPLPPSDAHALMLLLDAGAAGLLQGAIARQLGIDKSTASRLVARLTDRGHVEDAAQQADGRARPLRLTRAGVRVATEIDRASRQRFDQVLERIPRRRRRDVVQGLREIVTALEAIDGDDQGDDE